MAEKRDNDLRKIKELIQIMKDNDLLEVEIKHGDDKIFLKRSQAPQPAVAAVPMAAPNVSAARPKPSITEPLIAETKVPAQPLPPEEGLVEIKSPIVGTLYSAPSPDSEPYVEIGSHVELPTVVCTVEAMKVMNEIKADTDGTIAEILVKNGEAVEYGRVLFRVKPD